MVVDNDSPISPSWLPTTAAHKVPFNSSPDNLKGVSACTNGFIVGKTNERDHLQYSHKIHKCVVPMAKYNENSQLQDPILHRCWFAGTPDR